MNSYIHILHATFCMQPHFTEVYATNYGNNLYHWFNLLYTKLELQTILVQNKTQILFTCKIFCKM